MYQHNIMNQETVSGRLEIVLKLFRKVTQEKRVIVQRQSVTHCFYKLPLDHVKSGIQKGKSLQKVIKIFTLIS